MLVLVCRTEAVNRGAVGHDGDVIVAMSPGYAVSAHTSEVSRRHFQTLRLDTRLLPGLPESIRNRLRALDAEVNSRGHQGFVNWPLAVRDAEGQVATKSELIMDWASLPPDKQSRIRDEGQEEPDIDDVETKLIMRQRT